MARVGIHFDAWSIDNELTLSHCPPPLSLSLSLFLALYLSMMLPVRSAPSEGTKKSSAHLLRKTSRYQPCFYRCRTWYGRHSIYLPLIITKRNNRALIFISLYSWQMCNTKDLKNVKNSTHRARKVLLTVVERGFLSLAILHIKIILIVKNIEIRSFLLFLDFY